MEQQPEQNPSEEIYTPEQIQALKEKELEHIKAGVDKILERGFDPKKPFSRFTLTAIEHKLIGSTTDGRAFQPNVPLAFQLGSTLEVINKIREEMNATGEISYFIIDPTENTWIEAKPHLFALSEEILSDETGRQTFELGEQIHTYDNDNQVHLPKEMIDVLIKKTQDEAKRKLFNEIEKSGE
jgi:hypothetical protein